MVSSPSLEPEPSMRYSICFSVATLSLVACSRSDRGQQVAECVDIYRTAYVTGGVGECLVKRYGWSPEDATEAERKLESHPDSAALGDSGQVGDSLRR
jgi:hypothetical protein